MGVGAAEAGPLLQRIRPNPRSVRSKTLETFLRTCTVTAMADRETAIERRDREAAAWLLRNEKELSVADSCSELGVSESSLHQAVARHSARLAALEPAAVHSCGVAVRPCPNTACRFHLARPDRGARDAKPEGLDTCALDVADRGPQSLDEVSVHLGISRQRVATLEERAVRRAREACARLGVRFEDLVTGGMSHG